MINLLVSFWFVLISSVYANTCFNRSGFFVSNGAYDLNRQAMLSSLPSNVTANDGFYTTSTGQDPNRVYGLGMCFPGTEARSCSDCIMAASNGLVKNCTNHIDAIDWRMYGTTLCLVHYSNRSFYGSLDMEIIRSDNYTRDFQANVTDLEITWEALMIGLIDQASSLYYAARTQKLESSISHVYGVVQCSRDISLENCTRCLQENVIKYRSCCRGTQGGIFSRPSYGKGVSTGTIVAIVIIPILLLALGFAIWKRRKSHKAFTTATGNDISTSGSLQFYFKAIEAATSNFHNINKLGHGGFVSFWFVLISTAYANTCLNRSGFFAPNGAYDLNRQAMLSTLPSNVTANDGFYTTSTGQDPNRVYGLGMCFPGTEAGSCSDCIIAASNGLVHNCTTQTEAIDWRMYRNTLCLVRYSNRSFYGSLDMQIIRSNNYTRDFQFNMTDLEITWEALMIGLIDQASSLYYAARTQKLESSTSHVYGVVQCSRDLSLQNCTRCLQQNVIEYTSCCRGTQGGTISRPSCFVRWEVYPFLALLDNMPPLEKDPVTGDNYDKYEVIRCVHIGLLCVQENPTDRPSMFTICQMLTNTSITLPVPQPPGFFFRVRSENIPLAESFQPAPSSSMSIACSVNDATITCVSPLSFWCVLISTAYANTCLNRSGFFAPDGTYDLNRRVMLSSLASNVTANDGFYTTSTGQDPNRIYGLGMCVPGIEAGSCFDCIMAASNGLVQNCTTQTEAIDWRMYRNTLCLVRYSNRSFYGSLDMEIIRHDYNTRDYQSNGTDFDMTWEALMVGVIEDVSSTNYAAGRGTLESSNTNIYGFMQCSRDISPQNCTRCLQQNVIDYRSCCRGRQGGTVSRPSCFLRWEIFAFLGLPENIPPPERDERSISTGTIVAIVIVPIILLALGFGIWRKRKSYKACTTENGYFSAAKRLTKTYNTAPPDNSGDDISTSGSLQFDFKAIEAATSNFHNTNKLGHGGFGEVYKGTFPNGTEIAVKRLSKTSGQGEREFKNEVLLVAKLQHRNLVRLLGFCVQGEEKILVYDGYMPPEYVANGKFSTKSDVYSFGVLILEIIGGKKNSRFHEIDGSTGNLVWRLWNNDSLLELVDPIIGDNYDKYEVIRCVHIGLLCVQENPTDRPSMFTIFQMLTNTSITLPVPQPPGFFFRVRAENIPLAESFQPAPSTSMSVACSVNDVSITAILVIPESATFRFISASRKILPALKSWMIVSRSSLLLPNKNQASLPNFYAEALPQQQLHSLTLFHLVLMSSIATSPQLVFHYEIYSTRVSCFIKNQVHVLKRLLSQSEVPDSRPLF
ncbi:hypothetical protein IGI04_001291 [Brassica rapa subsp. trilocularis]|uniref:Uncharacterized protein n=1 Tax=Brassica rapa subsp. trilocularis TaxID=1813537 RepID=A0ABQ7NSD5_BRACM|nr:hypothetical protein IGI04_001291 [Brassica rapa subsp. trilocularis]